MNLPGRDYSKAPRVEKELRLKDIEATVRRVFGRSLTQAERERFLKNGTFMPGAPAGTGGGN